MGTGPLNPTIPSPPLPAAVPAAAAASPPATTTTRRMTLHDNSMDSEDDDDGSGNGGHFNPTEPPTHRTQRDAGTKGGNNTSDGV